MSRYRGVVPGIFVPGQRENKYAIIIGGLQNFCHLKFLPSDPMQGGDFYVHGLSFESLGSFEKIMDMAKHMFIDEEMFEDNGQITAIRLRAGTEIYAIQAR